MKRYTVVPELLSITTREELAGTFCYHTFSHFANHLFDVFDGEHDGDTLLDCTFRVEPHIDVDREACVNHGSHYIDEDDSTVYFDREILGVPLQYAYTDRGESFEFTFNKWYYRTLRFSLGGNLQPAGLVLQNVVTAKLLERGYLPLHCASLSNGSQTVLLPANPDTGKSTTVLNGVERGYSYVGEEVAVVDADGTAYAVPFTTSYAKYLDAPKLKVHSRISEIVPAFPFFMKQPTDGIRRFVDGMDIEAVSEATEIAFMKAGSGGLTEVDDETLVERILSMNRPEFPYHHDRLPSYLDFYGMDLDVGGAIANERRIIEAVVGSLPGYTIECEEPMAFIDRVEELFQY